MNDIQPFQFPATGQQVRSLLASGEPWFIAVDVCAVLGIGDARKTVSYLDDDERTTSPVIDSMGREQQTLIVNEPGLYSMILRSRKPEAKAFKRWITHEVLPSIRKTGSYAVAPAFQIPATFAEALELAARQAREIDAEKAKVAELEPSALAWDVLAAATGDYSVRDAAQILNRDPAITTGQNRLFVTLRELTWVDSKGVPYQGQVDCGRLVQRPTSYTHPHKDEPVLSSQVRITPKGLAELHKRLGGSNPLALW